MRTVKQTIKAILQGNRAARNSDVDLWIEYAQQSGMGLTSEQIAVFRKMPSMETIRRTRQIIQNTEGILRPDPTVDRYRFKKYQAMRQGVAHEEPENILEPINVLGVNYKEKVWRSYD